MAKIKITNVSIVGDTRFDRVLQIKEAAKQLPVVEAFLKTESEEKPKVFVAGSSWQPDEDIFIPWLNEHPDWKVIVAPHVISEDHLQQIEAKFEGRKVARYTDLERLDNLDNLGNLDCLIINQQHLSLC